MHVENANVAHLGDLQFNRRFPFVDRSAGASIAGWIGVLQKIRKTYDKDTLFVFGHAFGPVRITGNKEDLKAFEKYLASLLAFVKKEIRAGKAEADILKARPPSPASASGRGRASSGASRLRMMS